MWSTTGLTGSLVKAGTFDDIKVTAKDSGGKDIYYTPDRYTAVCIFDKNYQSSWKDGTAKVKEMYVFDNPTALKNSSRRPQMQMESGLARCTLLTACSTTGQAGFR